MSRYLDSALSFCYMNKRFSPLALFPLSVSKDRAVLPLHVLPSVLQLLTLLLLAHQGLGSGVQELPFPC